MGVFLRAAQGDGPLDPRRGEATASGSDGPRNGEEFLAVGEFQPLGDNLTRGPEGLVDAPEGAAPTMPGKGKACAIQPLGDVPGLVDPDEEEGDPLLARLLQGGQPVGGLLEAGPELPAQGLHVVAPGLGGPGEGGVGHQQGRRGVAGQSPTGQAQAAFGLESARRQYLADLGLKLEIGRLQGQLEGLAGAVEGIVQQDLPPVAIQPPGSAGHDIRRQAAHPQAMLNLQVASQALIARHGLGQPFGGVIQSGEAVTAGGQEAAGLGDGICGVGGVPLVGTSVGESQLLLAVSGVEPKEGLGDSREVGGGVGHLKGLQLDSGEHGITQGRLEPGGVVPALRRKRGDVQPVGLGQAHQHFSAEGPVVALQEGDVGGRDLEVLGHVRLGQAQVPPQPAQAWPHIQPPLGRHGQAPTRVASLQHYKSDL